MAQSTTSSASNANRCRALHVGRGIPPLLTSGRLARRQSGENIQPSSPVDSLPASRGGVLLWVGGDAARLAGGRRRGDSPVPSGVAAQLVSGFALRRYAVSPGQVEGHHDAM